MPQNTTTPEDADGNLVDPLPDDNTDGVDDLAAPGYPAANPDADILEQMGKDDDLSDVPAEFTFETTEAEDYEADDPENRPVTIALDGIKVKVYRPSDSALALRASQIINAGDDPARLLAMIGLLEAALDPATANYVKGRMLVKPQEGRKFKNDVIGKLVELILRKWGSDKQAAQVGEAVKPPPANRAEKRAADKAARKQK